MNGEIIYFDAERGIGFITGRDGNRYVFDRADLQGADLQGADLQGADRIAKGAKVEFAAEGDRARAIAPLDARGAAVVATAERPAATAGQRETTSGSVPPVRGSAGTFPQEIAEPASGLGVFAYFSRCLTSHYANFRGRARRKEFWSFALVSIPFLGAALFVGLVLDFLSGNLREVASNGDFAASGAPWLTIATGVVLGLVLIVPSIAVTVRRIHDIGLSGWFWLLTFVPSVGSLIILVFMLIRSQRHPNKWGPVPAGVRV